MSTTVPSLKEQQSAEQIDRQVPGSATQVSSRQCPFLLGGTGFRPDAGQSLLGLGPQFNTCLGQGLPFFGAGGPL